MNYLNGEKTNKKLDQFLNYSGFGYGNYTQEIVV